MNQWFICIKYNEGDIFDFKDANYMRLVAPEGHYYADPFLAEHEDKTYLFFEDYDYKKGKLACMEIETWRHHGVKNSTPIPLATTYKVVLEEPHHLSFPSVVQIDGEWYMTPERTLAGALCLYWSPKQLFPHHWEMIAVVAHGRYDDPLLKKTADGFEISCNEDGDKRRIFRAKSLDVAARWDLAKAEDEQYARNAGHPIGSLEVRQDSLPTYGRAIVFKEGVDKVVRVIEPTWYPGLTGTHTFNVSDKYVAIDGRIKLDEKI